MKRKGKFILTIKTSISFALCITAFFCIFLRLPQFFSQNPAVLAAASFTLSDGTYKLIDSDQTENQEDNSVVVKKNQIESTASTPSDNASKKRDKSNYYDSFADHTGENKYEISENSYFGAGTQVKNFYVKNKTDVNYDFSKYLNSPLTFNVEKNVDSPQVLIYHTHTTEGYMDEGVDYFYESFYSRTENSDFNVVAVGNKITEVLNSKGISTYHDTTIHDATYEGAYERSGNSVNEDMKKYKDIKVVLDIHRDALGTEDHKIKPVFTYNGKKAAQIMILSGCDDGSNWFPNWENNLNFALKIQNKAEELYPGMTRPLSFDYFRYNEYICDGSLLIEIGTDANSIDEVEYSGELLANVLAEVLS
ncbi:MAG: stage II sporulation protein P [Ruminococcus sp.]|nr:stage II sporulation protein P [Ruminococcus sp.]